MPITVKRLSDGSTYLLEDIDPGSFVNTVKRRIRKEFAPQFKNGCRLLFNGKVMKSRHRLKHYKVEDNGIIEMDDRKNWSSSSSSSSSED
ncbi:hypothetical protein BpHYR1_021664 [Brachionus plicatilis]|uniref:Ubiquitin-like domain-containing protein n=1 Tax=Brachionus plicatilis TaxID=10195 RepID=A0A3M7RUH9_BRAPC|nr:hypothetical protein BpHYR1_021664 [Brachionus plicatilis]